MTEQFLPELSLLSEKIKEANRAHAEHIVTLGAMQKELLQDQKIMLAQLRLEAEANPVGAEPAFRKKTEEFMEACEDFENAMKAFRKSFQQQIDDTNFALGSISNLWGGYIENIGVQYMLNSLRKDHGVHTWFQKFKRYWHKSRNVEIDLLALSDTHAYIIEVKNQLKSETFTQVLTVLDKINEKVPEYKDLIKQPVIVCMHAEEKLVKAVVNSNVWILRYKGFDRNAPQDSFEWLKKG